jgi:integrase
MAEIGIMSGAGRTKAKTALNATRVKNLKPEGEPYRIADQLCRGLAIRVATSGQKTWDCAFRVAKGGPQRRLSLGNADDVTLEQARARAFELTSAARQGRDLVAEESQARDELTVAELIDRYLTGKVTGRLRTAAEIDGTLRRILAPLASKSAASVHRRDLARLFDDLAVFQQRERAAAKARQMIGSMYRWAIERGLVDINPVEGTPRFTQGEPRERVLSPDEIRILWDWLPTVGFASSLVDIARLEICTGARSGEIAGMEVKEFNLSNDAWLWTLPAARSKNKKERVTPIVGMAREILAARLVGADGLLFRSSRGVEIGSSLLASHLRHRWNRFPIEHFTAHDLRRTVASQMAAMGIPLETIALAVGHAAGEKATRTLVRHYVFDEMLDRKRRALEAWDQRLRSILDSASGSNVTPLYRPVDNFRRQSP